MNRSGVPEKPFERRACLRSGPKDHALDRLRDLRVVFQSRLQSLQDSVADRKRNRNERISRILSGNDRREVSMGSKIQVNILALEVSTEIELSGIHGMVRNREFSLCDDPVAVGKRFTRAFCRHLKADGAIVDAADEGNKSLDGAELIQFWFVQDQESDGVFLRIERSLTAAPVTGIGCHLVPVPEREHEKGQETSGPRGADLPKDKCCNEERYGPGRPPFRLLIRGEYAERRSDEEPGKRSPLTERQPGRGGTL